jgi:hypothetical protein
MPFGMMPEFENGEKDANRMRLIKTNSFVFILSILQEKSRRVCGKLGAPGQQHGAARGL